MIDHDTEFFKGLLELHYGVDVVDKLKKISYNVGWAHNWPENDMSFWNAEAFMWGYKIDKGVRKLIENELSSLKGKNLDVGCGSYSYIKSVGVDFSSKMLQFNDNCIEKIEYDLEKGLPSLSGFDSVTAVFVLNYIRNLEVLLGSIKDVLVKGGVFVCVLYGKELNSWQKQKEVNSYDFDEWKGVLSRHFNVTCNQKEDLWFFRCRNV
jgi:SAM-dependent methyltransferase